MPWRLTSRLDPEDRLPVDVRGVLPTAEAGSPAALPIYRGRRRHRLDELFEVERLDGDVDLIWSGPLAAIHHLGAGMTAGSISVLGTLGRHAGRQMSGGQLTIEGDAGDFLGAEMRGGQIRVRGSAGHQVGGAYPGTRAGMNRGEIFIGGSAGDSLGQAMRRGTILVGGRSGELTGWNLNAGTIVVLGGVGDYPGAGMRRGTIVSGAGRQAAVRLLPSMVPGPAGSVPVLALLKRWLQSQLGRDAEPLIPAERLVPLGERWIQYHGDGLHGGRGELFFAPPSP